MQKSQKSTLSAGPWTLILQIQNQNAIKTFSCLIIPAQDTFKNQQKQEQNINDRTVIWQYDKGRYKNTKYILIQSTFSGISNLFPVIQDSPDKIVSKLMI